MMTNSSTVVVFGWPFYPVAMFYEASQILATVWLNYDWHLRNGQRFREDQDLHKVL